MLSRNEYEGEKMEIALQHTIYIGLNDPVTGQQKFDTAKYVDILKHVCQSYHVAFSYHELDGGYFYENGEFTQEHTLALMLVSANKDTVNNIAKDLCAFFNQESVMVTSSPCSVVFVKENLTDLEDEK